MFMWLIVDFFLMFFYWAAYQCSMNHLRATNGYLKDFLLRQSEFSKYSKIFRSHMLDLQGHIITTVGGKYVYVYINLRCSFAHLDVSYVQNTAVYSSHRSKCGCGAWHAFVGYKNDFILTFACNVRLFLRSESDTCLFIRIEWLFLRLYVISQFSIALVSFENCVISFEL